MTHRPNKYYHPTIGSHEPMKSAHHATNHFSKINVDKHIHELQVYDGPRLGNHETRLNVKSFYSTGGQKIPTNYVIVYTSGVNSTSLQYIHPTPLVSTYL